MLASHRLVDILGLIQIFGGIGVLHLADTGRVQIRSVKVGPGDIGIGKICRCQLDCREDLRP